MQHFPFWLALAAGLGTACLLGGVSAAAEDFPAVPVATATTQGTWETHGDGSRCYYDADGTPVTGEVTIDGTAYLFDYTGTQKTGWRTVDGERRYYDPETGELVLGWVESGGYRYYTDDSGLKETGEQEIDGHRYSFSETYGMQDTGIHAFSDGSLSYYNVEGEIQTGWQTDGNSSYYFSEDTETALLGLQEIDGALYYFGEDGKLVCSRTVTLDGVVYRADASGRLTTELTPITGTAQATAAQMTAYLRAVNPNVAQSVLDMIPCYLSEGAAEGIRGDIAFAQSCLETGELHLSWLGGDAGAEQFLRHGRDQQRRKRQFLCHAAAGNPCTDPAPESLCQHGSLAAGLRRRPLPVCAAGLCPLCGVAGDSGESQRQGLGRRCRLRGKDPANPDGDSANVRKSKTGSCMGNAGAGFCYVVIMRCYFARTSSHVWWIPAPWRAT